MAFSFKGKKEREFSQEISWLFVMIKSSSTSMSVNPYRTNVIWLTGSQEMCPKGSGK